MEPYKILFEKQFLNGDKYNSSISLKGVIQIIKIFEENYKLISITVIDEDEFLQNFINFKNVAEPYINKFPFVYEKINNIEYTSFEENYLYSEINEFIKKYSNYKDNKKEYFEEISENYDLFIRL